MTITIRIEETESDYVVTGILKVLVPETDRAVINRLLKQETEMKYGNGDVK